MRSIFTKKIKGLEPISFFWKMSLNYGSLNWAIDYSVKFTVNAFLTAQLKNFTKGIKAKEFHKKN